MGPPVARTRGAEDRAPLRVCLLPSVHLTTRASWATVATERSYGRQLVHVREDRLGGASRSAGGSRSGAPRSRLAALSDAPAYRHGIDQARPHARCRSELAGLRGDRGAWDGAMMSPDARRPTGRCITGRAGNRSAVMRHPDGTRSLAAGHRRPDQSSGARVPRHRRQSSRPGSTSSDRHTSPRS
jgi:hypothetical protein